MKIDDEGEVSFADDLDDDDLDGKGEDIEDRRTSSPPPPPPPPPPPVEVEVKVVDDGLLTTTSACTFNRWAILSSRSRS